MGPHRRLGVYDRFFWIDARSQKGCRNLARLIGKLGRVLRYSDGVQINNTKHAIMLVLKIDEFFERAQVISQM